MGCDKGRRRGSRRHSRGQAVGAPARRHTRACRRGGSRRTRCLSCDTAWLVRRHAGLVHTALAAGAFVAVASYARSVRRAYLIGGIVATAGAVQFCWSFVAWWGGRDQSIPMVGTFYWHNQFAAFLLAPALIALALLVGDRAPWRLVGWVVAPLATAGVVYSSSRGGLGILIVGWLLVGVLACRVKPNRGRARQVVSGVGTRGGRHAGDLRSALLRVQLVTIRRTQARSSAGGTADASSVVPRADVARGCHRLRSPPASPASDTGRLESSCCEAHSRELATIAACPQRLPAGSCRGRLVARRAVPRCLWGDRCRLAA